jgi:branched-chain amino acid aminotransferase
MMSWCVVNAELTPALDARVMAGDRGFLLGDGLFETMRADSGRVFRRSDHLARLARSCAAFALALPWSPEELGAMVGKLLAANELDSARVRLTVTRGRHAGAMGLAGPGPPTLLITAEPLPPGLDDRLARGLTLAVAGVRFSEHNPIFRHKTLNRLPHLFARSEAERAGADEALVLDERGNVAGVSTGNIFAYERGQLFTPPLTGPVLPGVTRGVVLELARREGLPVREDFFSPLMLGGAAEIFVTNSIQEIVSVVKVGPQPVGSGRPGPLAAKLLSRYRELTGREEKDEG